MYILNIGNTIKIKVKDPREFRFENYYKLEGISKKDS